MRITEPLGLLGLLGIIILIIIYILKSKYVEKPVSSTFMWKRSLKYMKTRIPFKFVLSLMLILQVLTVVVISLAIARPTITPFSTNDKIIIIDTSASMMTANENGQTRFDLAIEQAKKEAETANDNNKITIIQAGAEADRSLFRSSDKMEIINVLSSITCSQAEADIDGALKLANEVQNLNNEAKIYYYTDKQHEDTQNVEVVDFSKDSDWNLAITKLTDTYMGKRYSFNALVSNYGSSARDVNVAIYITQKDGTVDSYVKTFNIGADSSKQITFAYRDSGYENFLQIGKLSDYESATVKILDSGDGLETDNSRTIYQKEENRLKILVVSQYIQTETADDGSDQPLPNNTTYIVEVLRVIGYSLSNKTDIKSNIDQVDKLEGYDLYIFDGSDEQMPDEILPEDGAVWFIDSQSNPVGTDIEISLEPENVDAPYYIKKAVDDKSNTYSTITSNIKFDGVGLKQYNAITSYDKEKYTEIFTVGSDPVMIAGRENSVRVIVMSFDLIDSNLHVQGYFPLLISNMIEYSVPEVLEKSSYTVGEKAKFNAPVGTTNVVFKYEDSILDAFSSQDTTFNLDKVGVYSVEVEYLDGTKQNYRMPTSIANEESDISVVGGAIVALDTTMVSETEKEPIEAWPYVVMALILILVLEWGVYYRNEF